MRTFLRVALGAAAVVLAGHAAAEATLYERHDYQGKALMTPDPIEDLGPWGFGGNTSSIVIAGPAWQVCDGPRFTGSCVVLQAGNYRNLRDIGLPQRPWSLRPEPPYVPPPPAQADGQITFYQDDGFSGRAVTMRTDIPDFRNIGFNDRASSIVVSGTTWQRWLACEHVGYAGRCVVLGPGVYPSLGAMGLADRLSSARPLGRNEALAPGLFVPMPTPMGDWQPRPQERLYDVQVSAIRAVYGSPQQRCWVERETVVQRGDPGAGALIGGLIGGILGHELAGRGNRDVGTVGGAVAGAAIGATASQGYVSGTQNVQRCSTVPPQHPAYWDVMYVFRGVEHHVQMTNPPPNGTVRVNEAGEPRG